MKLRVQHEIDYRYNRPVLLSPQQLFFRPREGPMLDVRKFDLHVDPIAEICWTRDHRDNTLAWAYIDDFQDHLSVRADFEVETRERNPFGFVLRSDAVRFPFQYEEAEASLLAPYMAVSSTEADCLRRWLREHLPEASDNTLDQLAQINRTMREQLTYRERWEAGVQTPEETFARRGGTCRDFAVAMMTLCRALGIAARFVSGYLYDDSEAARGNAGSLHAWVELYLPGGGWKGFDPTHGILVDDHFIPVASGRRPENLNPMTGAFYGAEDAHATMSGKVCITKIA